ncbi:hypothetical protein E2C01_050857 [Portunus trituberculatus]|uniref:Uncharacterized protein n=1 Tax=Portunus trituberculatus TaxID=210409 RepID=A0A5B7GA32_PORTR|nr:hypothetical protein [Portunus trituberculatus]
MTGEAVGQYLRAHPEFLESWLMEQVELETLERWMIRRTQRDKQKSLENDTNEFADPLLTPSMQLPEKERGKNMKGYIYIN